MNAEFNNWRKSTRSPQNNNCVEVAWGPDATAVRDSKHRTGSVLVFSPNEFEMFVRSVRDGRNANE